MLKKLLFIISLLIFSNITFFLSAEIIPLKKPVQTKNEKEQKLLIDILKPLPKPIINKIIKKDEKKLEKNTISKNENELGIILPKKKPLIAGVKEKKITNVYFDRGEHKYHGRIKAFAETLRKNGLKF